MFLPPLVYIAAACVLQATATEVAAKRLHGFLHAQLPEGTTGVVAVTSVSSAAAAALEEATSSATVPQVQQQPYFRVPLAYRAPCKLKMSAEFEDDDEADS